MNKVKLTLLTVILATNAFANGDGCVDCDQSIGGMPDVSQVQQIQDTINPDIEVLANQICANMILINDTGTGKVYEAFERVILGYLNIDKSTPNYRSQVTNFWNEHKDRMICTDEVVGFESPQHILKRVIELDAISTFYFEYFLRDRNTNVNAVEYRDGNPETVIDYIDTILADPQADRLYDTAQVRQLRAFLTTMMDAKTAQELLRT